MCKKVSLKTSCTNKKVKDSGANPHAMLYDNRNEIDIDEIIENTTINVSNSIEWDFQYSNNNAIENNYTESDSRDGYFTLNYSGSN